MNTKFSNLFWGILLVTAGGIALAQTQGYLNNILPMIWVTVFAAISIIALVFYFLSGIQNWGMLFPAGIFGGLALIVSMATNNVDNPAMAAPLFVGIGLPFVVAYFLDRAKNWWAVIPTGVMAFLTFVLLAAENLGGEVIGSALFFILAATFGFVYATRRALWAAIVTYVMFVMGFMPLIAMSTRPELAGIVMLFGIALPFFIIYFRAPDERFWAIIPAGILTTTGLLTAFVLLPGLPDPAYDDRIPNAILYAGIAITFAVVWLRHHKRWALLLTVLAAIMAVVNTFLGDLQQYWPVLVVLAGFYLLYSALRPKTA
ncbi:MAG: hypothetical protein CVU44_09725 [Chloroflexi bacterium HGW-Chloroflexi-6]|nr:MAG: hypothetical protein CVU44_09725 [Chloroflexi bacterium HGW-Chloroflexi-6]